jgi:uncharacterized 2Fe-2S/4Fe-4S cluster protein (DUF4445 family)
VAGGFGYKLDLKKAAAIGMLPEALLPKTTAVGNAALSGAVALALEGDRLQETERICQYAEEISLASDRDFQELYMEYMLFEPA